MQLQCSKPNQSHVVGCMYGFYYVATIWRPYCTRARKPEPSGSTPWEVADQACGGQATQSLSSRHPTKAAVAEGHLVATPLSVHWVGLFCRCMRLVTVRHRLRSSGRPPEGGREGCITTRHHLHAQQSVQGVGAERHGSAASSKGLSGWRRWRGARIAMTRTRNKPHSAECCGTDVLKLCCAGHSSGLLCGA